MDNKSIRTMQDKSGKFRDFDFDKWRKEKDDERHKVPWYPDKYDKKIDVDKDSIEKYRKLIEEEKERQRIEKEEELKRGCRLCGVLKKEDETLKLDKNNICGNCLQKMSDWIFDQMTKDLREYCRKCRSHIKVCQCPETVDLRKMLE